MYKRMRVLGLRALLALSLLVLDFGLFFAGGLENRMITFRKKEDLDLHSAERLSMVETQIRRRGVKDERVLEALRKVPRHRFVPEDQRDQAYNDYPLPIGYGQTISQPYIVGLMTELLQLKPESRGLGIGPGSGYQ